MSRVMVLGGAGMLGHKLCQVLPERHETFATFRRPPAPAEVFRDVQIIDGIDVDAFDTVSRAIADVRPHVVVNAIGIVKQLDAAKDPVRSIIVNSLLPHRLAALCGSTRARLVHISTDCVFSGRTGSYTEADIPDPVDLYGRSKLLGEVDAPHALTLRTSIIGRELGRKTGLVEWFLSNAGGRVSGYANAIYSGLTTQALARIISDIVTSDDLNGIWHVSTDPISKYALLDMLNGAYGTNTAIDRDTAFHCDRSLESDRFWRKTGLARPGWGEMIRELAADRTPYTAIGVPTER